MPFSELLSLNICFHNNKANPLGLIFSILNEYSLKYPMLVLKHQVSHGAVPLIITKYGQYFCKLLDCGTSSRGFVLTIQWYADVPTFLFDP